MKLMRRIEEEQEALKSTEQEALEVSKQDNLEVNEDSQLLDSIPHENPASHKLQDNPAV